VRARFTLIVLALTVLALAGLRQGDQHEPEPLDGTPVQATQLGAKPASDAESSAALSAGGQSSAYVPTGSAWHSRYHRQPSPTVTSASRITPVIADRTGRPRSFPLLI
jgi:hypothetical protein